MKESRYNIWLERAADAWVFNTLSGKILGFSRKQRQAIDNFLTGDRKLDCTPDLLFKMAGANMLIPDDGDELAVLQHRYEVTRSDPSLFYLTIITSLGCNFDCPYCFEAKQPSIVDAEVQQLILRVLDDQLPRLKRFRVSWFGGEPLVGKQALLALSDQFLERCRRFGVDYDADITTNGYLLDEETCPQLRDRQVSHVQVSLDGPPQMHDRMRPLVNGKPTFWKIVENLHHAVNYMDVSVRMNVDAANFSYAEQLLQILEAEGFAGKLSVYPGQIVNIDDGAPSPSATYQSCCLPKAEFARAETQFRALATSYGFHQPSLPKPAGTPCMAVRTNELAVGSRGELYKCRDTVGNALEVVGHIRDYAQLNGRLRKWLNYDPFSDPECRTCVALPVCMGGCARYSMNTLQHENRCGTFRHNYRERILAYVQSLEQPAVGEP